MKSNPLLPLGTYISFIFYVYFVYVPSPPKFSKNLNKISKTNVYFTYGPPKMIKDL